MLIPDLGVSFTLTGDGQSGSRLQTTSSCGMLLLLFLSIDHNSWNLVVLVIDASIIWMRINTDTFFFHGQFRLVHSRSLLASSSHALSLNLIRSQ